MENLDKSRLLYTIVQAADILSVSAPTLRRAICEGPKELREKAVVLVFGESLTGARDFRDRLPFGPYRPGLTALPSKIARYVRN